MCKRNAESSNLGERWMALITSLPPQRNLLIYAEGEVLVCPPVCSHQTALLHLLHTCPVQHAHALTLSPHVCLLPSSASLGLYSV